LLMKLWQAVEPLIENNITDRICWTDSEIVLHWLQLHASTLAGFVANRIAEIQEASQKINWRHVPSKQKAADIISRGCTLEELEKSSSCKGPAFLQKPEIEWPINKRFETAP